jgi:GNAT superfamily N-acetyltransferase
MIGELAEYEHARHEVVATAELIHGLLFGTNTPTGAAAAFAHVVDADPPALAGDAPRLAGFALWFLNASTWVGRHGIYLEDLFVRPQFRGRGYGSDLMAELAAICLARGYGRLEWWVLDWNTPAIDFYRAHGAVGMDQWTVHRLDGPALAAMAARARPT